MRIRAHSHAAREISLVPVNSGPVDLRVAEPAHLGVNEIFAAPQQVAIMTRPLERPAGLPWWYARDRLEVVNEIPTFGGRGGVGVCRHRAARKACRETHPNLLGFAAASKRPRRRQIANERGISLRILQITDLAAVRAVTADAAELRVEQSAAFNALGIARTAWYRYRRGLVLHMRDLFDPADHGGELGLVQQVTEGRHRAPGKSVGDDSPEVRVCWWGSAGG
jgi:hypothetical protein